AFAGPFHDGESHSGERRLGAPAPETAHDTTDQLQRDAIAEPERDFDFDKVAERPEPDVTSAASLVDVGADNAVVEPVREPTARHTGDPEDLLCRNRTLGPRHGHPNRPPRMSTLVCSSCRSGGPSTVPAASSPWTAARSSTCAGWSPPPPAGRHALDRQRAL